MIEIFSILQNNYHINGIRIEDLNALFLNNDTSVYSVSMIGKNKIILKNKEENKFEKLECICNYFDTHGETECADIMQKVTCCGSSDSCKDCFKCALRKLETGEMTLK